jgi:tellurium resistance protein TerZ
LFQYYGNLTNSNSSILHSGDEKTGVKKGEDESILFQLDRVPRGICAMYIIITVATPNKRLSDIKSTLRVFDIESQYTICSFTPSEHPDATAMFLVRLARSEGSNNKWLLTPIEDTHPTARDFGSLLPLIKSYTRDLVPDIKIDPTERVAILRKGGNIRLTDYCRRLPDTVTFGLAWDVTQGVNIDLDASVICLGKDLKAVDAVWHEKLESVCEAIQHGGDEQEGDEVGDDESIHLALRQVDPSIHYIGFIVDSYTGQELDDVARASCHLYDTETGEDLATYVLTKSSLLDGYTALLAACIYRGNQPDEWCLHIIFSPMMARPIKYHVKDLQQYLKSCKLVAPDNAKEELARIHMPARKSIIRRSFMVKRRTSIMQK